MISPTLSCSVVGFPTREFSDYVQVAQNWAGDLKVEADGVSAFWLEDEIVAFQESPWMRKPGSAPLNSEADDLFEEIDVSISSRRSIVRIASKEETDIIVVISNFSSVTAALRHHFVRNLSSRVFDIQLDLRHVCEHFADSSSPRVEFVMGRDHDTSRDAMFSASPSDTSNRWLYDFPFKKYDVTAVSFVVNGIPVKVYGNMAMQIAGAPSDHQLRDALFPIFGYFNNYMSFPVSNPHAELLVA